LTTIAERARPKAEGQESSKLLRDQLCYAKFFFWAMGLHREEKAHKIPAQQNERKKFKNQN